MYKFKQLLLLFIVFFVFMSSFTALIAKTNSTSFVLNITQEDGNLYLTWPEVEGAKYYKPCLVLNDGSLLELLDFPVESTRYIYKGAIDGIGYKFVVKAQTNLEKVLSQSNTCLIVVNKHKDNHSMPNQLNNNKSISPTNLQITKLTDTDNITLCPFDIIKVEYEMKNVSASDLFLGQSYMGGGAMIENVSSFSLWPSTPLKPNETRNFWVLASMPANPNLTNTSAHIAFPLSISASSYDPGVTEPLEFDIDYPNSITDCPNEPYTVVPVTDISTIQLCPGELYSGLVFEITNNTNYAINCNTMYGGMQGGSQEIPNATCFPYLVGPGETAQIYANVKMPYNPNDDPNHTFTLTMFTGHEVGPLSPQPQIVHQFTIDYKQPSSNCPPAPNGYCFKGNFVSLVYNNNRWELTVDNINTGVNTWWSDIDLTSTNDPLVSLSNFNTNLNLSYCITICANPTIANKFDSWGFSTDGPYCDCTFLQGTITKHDLGNAGPNESINIVYMGQHKGFL